MITRVNERMVVVNGWITRVDENIVLVHERITRVHKTGGMDSG